MELQLQKKWAAEHEEELNEQVRQAVHSTPLFHTEFSTLIISNNTLAPQVQALQAKTEVLEEQLGGARRLAAQEAEAGARLRMQLDAAHQAVQAARSQVTKASTHPTRACTLHCSALHT